MNNTTDIVLAAVAAVLIAGHSFAQSASTALTYQGRLTDGGTLATGVYDFHFELYRSDDGSWEWLDEVWIDDLDVSDGYFTAVLDFTVGPSGDEAMALAVEVRPGASSGPYEPLTPIQELTKVPQAQRALTATEVDGGVVDATELRIHGGVVVDGSGTWQGQGSTVPCIGCVGTPEIVDHAVTHAKIEPGSISSDLIDPAGGIYVSKTQLYDVFATEPVPPHGFVFVFAECNDLNDLPISGDCTTMVVPDFRIEASYAQFWTTEASKARWNCQARNSGTGSGSLWATIICLDVP